MNPQCEPTYAELKEDIAKLKQRLAEMGEEAIELHTQVIQLKSELEGPDPYKTWQEAATAERMKRMDVNKRVRELEAREALALPLIQRWLEVGNRDWGGFQKQVEKYLGVNQPEPIPKNVAFDASTEEFYDTFYDFRTMGDEFRKKWFTRYAEFPEFRRNCIGTWP